MRCYVPYRIKVTKWNTGRCFWWLYLSYCFPAKISQFLHSVFLLCVYTQAVSLSLSPSLPPFSIFHALFWLAPKELLNRIFTYIYSSRVLLWGHKFVNTEKKMRLIWGQPPKRCMYVDPIASYCLPFNWVFSGEGHWKWYNIYNLHF